MRTAVAQWLRSCATNRMVAGSIPAGVTGCFIDIKSFLSHYGPGVDSASNRSEYQEYLLGVKAATLPPSCAIVTKSGNLNFLEPSGPVQTCNGTALPFYHLSYYDPSIEVRKLVSFVTVQTSQFSMHISLIFFSLCLLFCIVL